MNLQLDIEALQLGKYSDLHAIFGLSDDEIAATVSIKGEQALRHYSFTKVEQAQLAKLKVDADAVFVLLPEAPLEKAKSQVYQDTLALVPQLAQSQKVYLFPYGRCAMQLALRQALKYLTKSWRARFKCWLTIKMSVYALRKLLNKQPALLVNVSSLLGYNLLSAVLLCLGPATRCKPQIKALLQP